MYILSENNLTAFNDKIKGYDREFSVRLHFTSPTDKTLTGTTIQSISVDEVVNSTDTLTLGCACSNKIVVKLIEPPTDIDYGNGVFTAYVGLKIDEENTVEVPLGKFYVTSAETSNDFKSLTLTGYDGFSQMTEIYETEIGVVAEDEPEVVETETEKVTLQALYGDLKTQLSEVCNIILKELTDEEMLDISRYELDTYSIKDITFQQAIGYVAGCFGGFARFDREGVLEIATYTTGEEEIGNDDGTTTLVNVFAPVLKIDRDLQYMNGFKKTIGKSLIVKSMVTGTQEHSIECGEGGSGVDINFENPYITQAMANDVWAKYDGAKYTPCQVKWRGNPCVQAGDVVQAVDKDGNEHIVLIMSQNIKIGGGLNSTIECKGKSEVTSNLSTKFETTAQKIDQMYTTMEQAIVNATKAITGNSGGYVVVHDSNGDGYPDEILIMDHPDIEQATNVWRWNQNGLGHSSNGYDGSYGEEYAITADGQLNAKYITTGILNAEVVHIGDSYGNEIYMKDGLICFELKDSPMSMKLGNFSTDPEKTDYQFAIFNDERRIAYFSHNSFELENITNGKVRIQNFGFIPREPKDEDESGNLTFTKLT